MDDSPSCLELAAEAYRENAIESITNQGSVTPSVDWSEWDE